MERSLPVTLVVVAGVAASLLAGSATLGATLPVAGFASVGTGQLLIVLTTLAAFVGALALQRGPWAKRVEGSVPAALLALGFALSGRVLPELPVLLPAATLAIALTGTLLAWLTPPGGLWSGQVLLGARRLSLYVAALALFGGIYGLRLRALMTGPAIGLLAFVLALLLMRSGAVGDEGEQLAWRFISPAAFVAGLIVAQAAWALLFWPVNALVGGASLVMIFHVATGLLRLPVQGRGRWVQLMEYAALGIAALAVVIVVVLRYR